MKLDKDDVEKKVYNTLCKQIVGNIVYLAATSLGLMYNVSLISCYMGSPIKIHLSVAKRSLLFFFKEQETLSCGARGGEKSDLIGFSTSDYARDQDNRKSISGYAFVFRSTTISWLLKKQPIVTLSRAEAKFLLPYPMHVRTFG